MAYVDPSDKNQSDLITEAHWNQDIVENVQQLSEGQLIVVLDGSGSELATGIFGRIYFHHAYTIQAGVLGADQVGSVVVDLWKDVDANYPPTDADTITAAAELTLDSDDNMIDSTLTGWTTSIAAGDWLFFNLDSVNACQHLTVVLRLKRAS